LSGVSRKALLFSVIGAVLLAVIAAFLMSRWGFPESAPPRHSAGDPKDSNGQARPGSSSSVLTSGPAGYPPAGAPADEQTLLRAFESFLRDLRSGLSRPDVLARLAALKALVHDADPDVAATALIAALRSGEDAESGLAYVIGEEGVMAETPTYRTALLDLLGQTDPVQSMEYARELMSTTGAPDEYSLALRNLAWANMEGDLDGELQGWFGAMLQRQDWRQSPTPGYLEAFDVAVATGSLSQVSEVIATSPAPEAENEALVGRAAFVALDRLTVADASRVVAAFRRDPSLLSTAPVHRASILSRLDVRQPEQAALIREYLQRNDHGEGELEYFAEIFPNGNYFSSYRLITPWQSGLSMEEMGQLDRATLETFKTWMADPAFAGSRQHLQSVVTRLEEFAQPISATSP
jgi:hypothetical protein